jgi:flagellar hook protein FlgE
MSLFGALQSGVSGLSSQSSAMGAISDNITNVSTIGYKNTTVNFQTLVTAQTSTTLYSPGGVQSAPRQDTGVQGLLQATSSQTDISVSGNGFFIVNEASEPTISNEFLYTRAGSFYQDDEGYLRNTAGYYLQAWPTDASGTVIPANRDLSIANQNIISTDYLETVNLSTVGGTAAATSTIGVGVNLPSSDTTGQTHKTDVQFFDSLGNANTMSFVYTRTSVDNNWDLTVNPPPGTEVLTLEDSSGNVYKSIGQLEFTERPADGATVIIDGVTYEFDPSNDGIQAGNTEVDNSSSTSLSADVQALVDAVIANDTDFDTTNNRIQVSSASASTILFTNDSGGGNGTSPDGFVVDPTGLLDTNGSFVVRQETSFTVKTVHPDYSAYDQFHFTNNPSDGDIVTINGITYEFDDDATTAGTNIAVTIDDQGGGGTGAGSAIAVEIAATLANLETAIETNDPEFASGADTVRLRAFDGATANDTLVLSTLSSGSYTVTFSDTTGTDFTNLPTDPGGQNTYADNTAHTVQTVNAIVFDSDGLPSAFNVTSVEILGFENGAADMDGGTGNSAQPVLNFGNVGEANGFTQFGSEFTPIFISQNGSQFGTFAGVTVAADGLVTVLFDNGETRPVFKIPLATFTNTNGLETRSGNVWNATQASGDFTLRVANNGLAGTIQQAALEQSTVDIGEEFTDMIVVQRAYSAAARIISTSDEMLEELLRTKR